MNGIQAILFCIFIGIIIIIPAVVFMIAGGDEDKVMFVENEGKVMYEDYRIRDTLEIIRLCEEILNSDVNERSKRDAKINAYDDIKAIFYHWSVQKGEFEKPNEKLPHEVKFAYNRGFNDGMRALKLHLEMCAEEREE